MSSFLTKPVMLGYYASGNSDNAVLAAEQNAGRTFDWIIRYRDMGNYWGVEPMVQTGPPRRSVRIAWETRVYGYRSNPVTPASPTGYTYAQILNGQLDGYLAQMWTALKRIPVPFLIDLDHEADDSTALGGSSQYRANAGTPEQYVAALGYLVGQARGAGVVNARWGVCFSGWQSANSIYQWLWPAISMDWIGWDPYNHVASAWRSPYDTFAPFYNRLDAGMIPAATTVTRMLGEFGCIKDSRRPAWLEALPADLLRLPKIRAAAYYSSNATWPTALEGDAASVAAFGDAARAIDNF